MKKFLRFILAIAAAFVIANGICFNYYRIPGAYQLANSSVSWKYRPYSKYIQFYEGGSITQFDANGNSNQNKPLADNFVLLLGSSHQEGVHVSDSHKASYLLNEKLAGGDNEHLYVYNAAKAGHYFPDQVKGFKAFLEEYPGAGIVIIEYYRTGSLQKLKNAMNQTNYIEDNDLVHVMRREGMASKVNNRLKEMLPLINLLKSKQLLKASLDFSDAFGIKKNDPETVEEDRESFFAVMDQVFSLLREEYDGPIIMLYRPDVKMDESGELEPVYTSPEFEALLQGCSKYGFYLCDLGPAFVEDYNTNNHVPYGFINSVIGEGHLNNYGHAIEARELYRVIEEEVRK